MIIIKVIAIKHYRILMFLEKFYFLKTHKALQLM